MTTHRHGVEDGGENLVADYRYDATRKNNPPAALASQGRIQETRRQRYYCDPHLSPTLRFDGTGQADQVLELLDAVKRRTLTADEAHFLGEAFASSEPWLEWSGKREEQSWFEVDPVALHIHDRVSAQATIRIAGRQNVQRELWADPELDYHEAVQFYKHNVDWSNRLILGDSLLVMNSLATREDNAGKVQMIYIDPPYGIGFRSNFQPLVHNRNVSDRDADLTREPEMVKAYRDTWTLGVHTYLTYLRERLTVARHLLTDSGSIFVQIGEENVHRVRTLMGEVFGEHNFVGIIPYRTTGARGGNLIDSICDFIIWFGKNRSSTKYRQLFMNRAQETESNYDWIEIGQETRQLNATEKWTPQEILKGRKYALSDPTSQGRTESGSFQMEVHGRLFGPPPDRHWATTEAGMNNLV